MDEKELAVRLYKAWYGIEEFNGEADKLKPHWLRVAAEAARIAKEARVEALREAKAKAYAVYDGWWNAAEEPGVRNDWESLADGAASVSEEIQAMIDAETAPKGE